MVCGRPDPSAGLRCTQLARKTRFVELCAPGVSQLVQTGLLRPLVAQNPPVFGVRQQQSVSQLAQAGGLCKLWHSQKELLRYARTPSSDRTRQGKFKYVPLPIPNRPYSYVRYEYGPSLFSTDRTVTVRPSTFRHKYLTDRTRTSATGTVRYDFPTDRTRDMLSEYVPSYFLDRTYRNGSLEYVSSGKNDRPYSYGRYGYGPSEFPNRPYSKHLARVRFVRKS
ncbi:hypothetical protein F7D09_1573 [Bifidobacterium leontopitheci]|uniref:Uncharacterized protein n=1 Tax=Bifidobacterium leontopitheci TaxID=2650774 RepID=A0A6I1GJU6_9BIFI|nr:hypothetical protein F7D09_1573 [Bifidobacterium leontopitheci]